MRASSICRPICCSAIWIFSTSTVLTAQLHFSRKYIHDPTRITNFTKSISRFYKARNESLSVPTRITKFTKSISRFYKARIESISDPTEIVNFHKSVSRLYYALIGYIHSAAGDFFGFQTPKQSNSNVAGWFWHPQNRKNFPPAAG